MPKFDNGDELIVKNTSLCIDIIFLDIIMPRPRTKESFFILRQAERLKQCSLFLLSRINLQTTMASLNAVAYSITLEDLVNGKI